jgi:ATP-dependent exoDNAse (exonuclease V) beta subunit
VSLVGTALTDASARRAALLDSHRTLLVEAGAGSGKTSLMAGRVALLFASGVPPRAVAAITFTELAAADLAARIRSFVARLLSGEVPPELSVALPDGLDAHARANLAAANASLDDLTSTTIHGFCQDLVRPYPVEADVDPGARVADEVEAGLLFDDLRDRWLRERLGPRADPHGAIAAMVGVDVDLALRLVDETIGLLRAHRVVRPPPGGDVPAAYEAFLHAVAAVELAIPADAPAEALPFRRAAARLREHLEPHAGLPAALAIAALTLPATHLRVKRGSIFGYRAYRTKTAWCAQGGAEGASRHAEGAEALAALERAQEHLCQEAAAHALRAVLAEVGELLRAFGSAKRDAAMLDFDDLLVTADRLLRDHGGVRHALAARYRHVLVDEFQDTDPLQAAVLWRLCGDPPGHGPLFAGADDPLSWRLRPGALFVVGDPKQSIYRFRGADVRAYVAAREAIARAHDGAVLSVSTNFRSVASILAYANARFEGPLAAPGQGGFVPLGPWRADAGGAHVARLTVARALPIEHARPIARDRAVARDRPAEDADAAVAEPDAAERRDLEAGAVADAVASLIGRHPIASRGGAPCEAADIALLAPTGSDLWRFERALEERGVAVATQAGKGFYQRQEVHDLIALALAVADPRDRLALGALLRGPLVGCSDEELLDVAEGLAERPWSERRLTLTTDADAVAHPLVARTLRTLQDLRALARGATPYRVLWEGVARMRVRAILRARHGRGADRALANVDRLLELARPFGVRGLAAFARELRTRWADAERAVEGRPDAVRDAVTLLTVHSSKGLEWPVVMPVNTFGDVRRASAPVVDRRDGSLHARVLGTSYPALVEAVELEGEAEAQERVRLWYVAATRAKDLLVVPSPAFATADTWWCRVVDLATEGLPELTHAPGEPAARHRADGPPNTQTEEAFSSESARVDAARRRLEWQSPSRTAADEEPPIEPPHPRGEGSGDRVDADSWPVAVPLARGRVLHVLLQEVLAGELEETPRALGRRAGELLARLGFAPDGVDDRLRPDALAADVRRGLAVADVAAHRERLVPEVPVYALEPTEDGPAEGRRGEHAVVTVGIADAVAFADDGAVELVVDWKSDARPSAAHGPGYERQLRHYLRVLGAPRGVLVFLSTGEVREVVPRAERARG